MGSAIVPPQPQDVVAWITVRYHASGELSVSGTIGEPVFAKQMLEHAKDAIGRRVPESGLVIPGRDVECAPTLPGLVELGDIDPSQRGDP